MKPHVAILPSSGMGHIIPLFQLGKLLALHHGVQVSFIVITTAASAAQDQFFQSPAASVPNLSVINLPPADISSVVSDDMRLATKISIIIRESLKPLKSILSEISKTLDALIIDIFTTGAIDICREMSIPVYSFFTASTVLLTFSLYLPTLDGEVDGEFVDLPAPIEIPGCRPMRPNDVLDQVKHRTNPEYDWYLRHVSRLPETSGIFLNTWEDLNSDRIQALRENPFYKNILVPPVYPIGPLIKDVESPTEKEARILTWLDSQPPESVLYVCLGSGGTLSSNQLTELAWGLELSGQRFILVARRPEDSTASAVYFNVGSDDDDPSSYLPDGFLERTVGYGLVVPTWCPQRAVLRHRSIRAFLSHCGWNSTLESLVHGVPMVAWPLYAEQRMNAAMLVEEVGVAARLGPEAREEMIGREMVEKVVTAVMEGEGGREMRRIAQKLKESAAAALENGGSSERSLAGFLEIWKA